ncbi:GNAT family N-acetyltransferase [Verrucomicrobium sp. BvORR034]|uniref:GNAT family N-acetyltransferase n=1 Tax=Verrucomicrobium sp. BvORR034 TaxID=1396418 RepID=UPI0007C653B3|nr:GNAT family N-acetyltransferase [Verrucomicrobium sp. BvORR034]
MQLTPLTPADHDATASLLHRSLVHWYETRLRQGARFGDRPEPFRIFPEVYEALDPGHAVSVREDATGTLVGVCFIHPRETHVSVGIVATDPDSSGRGAARLMMEHAAAIARDRGQPLRLISSALNLDSFSLYTKLGFVPHTLYQDVLFNVPVEGLAGPPPVRADQVRTARPEDAVRMADLEQELQSIRRERDMHFFLKNEVGSWKSLVLENETTGELDGFMVYSVHPSFRMTGPGVARDESAATALLWVALDAQRGDATVLLAPCLAGDLVRTLYRWGGRNVELHTAQILGPLPQTKGLAFPTFLPESA